MAVVTPDEGIEFVVDTLSSEAAFDDWEMYQVAVGGQVPDGGGGLTPASISPPDATDTQLDNEFYRASVDDSVVTIEDSSVDGRIDVRITISGGTEVPTDAEIREFGIFAADPANAPADETSDADDRLLHREVRSGITLQSGDRKTFEIGYLVQAI